MFGNKFFITLVAMMVAIFAICNINTSSQVEGWWGNPARTVKVGREIKDKLGNFHSVPTNYSALLSHRNDFFQVPPSFQSMLPPRMSGNVNYGASIRYNMPSREHQGVPENPLVMGDMVKENYTPPSCGKSGVPGSRQATMMSANQADASFHDVKNKLEYTDITDVLPAGDMTTVDALGKEVGQVIYDRFVYANQRSRLYGLGDPIRGDLPIAPCNGGEWFRPSVHPQIDLRDGAISVIAGHDNATSKALHALQNAASGGAITNFGGVDYSDMSVNKNMGLSAHQSDVTISAFP